MIFESENKKTPQPKKKFQGSLEREIKKITPSESTVYKEVISIFKSFSDKFTDLFLVGGAVRDMVKYNKVNDFDFITPMLPYDVEQILSDLGFENINNGFKKYKKVDGGVSVESEFDKIKELEEGLKKNNKYVVEGHRPLVTATKTLEGKRWKFEISTYSKYLPPIVKDSKTIPMYEIYNRIIDEINNKDFTVNSLIMDERGYIYDYFQGSWDIHSKILKTVGNPVRRFEEEPRMMLRAIEFEMNRGYTLDLNTKKALQEVTFEGKVEMSPNVKNAALKNILSLKDGFITLYDYGIINDLLTHHSGNINQNVAKKYNALCNNFRELSKTNKNGIMTLFRYLLSRHISYNEKSKSIKKMVKKHGVKPEIAALTSYNRPFRLKETTIYNNIKIYSAIKTLMEGKEASWTSVLNTRKEIDAIVNSITYTKSKEQMYQLINTNFIPNFICISLLNGLKPKTVRKRVALYEKSFSEKYNYYFDNMEKATKHLEVCYGIGGRRSKPLIRNAITKAILSKDFISWKTILSDMSKKMKNANNILDIAGLGSGEFVNKKDSEFSMEHLIHHHVAPTIKGDISKVVATDNYKLVSAYDKFKLTIKGEFASDSGNKYYEQMQNDVEKLLTINNDTKSVSKIADEITTKYPRVFNELILEDSPFIYNSKGVQDYRSMILSKLNQFEQKKLFNLQKEYFETMNYYHQTFEDSLTQKDRGSLMSARDLYFDVFKDKDFYWNFYSENIRIDKKGNLRLQDAPSMESVKSFRDIDWFILNKYQFKHNNVIMDIRKRMNVLFEREDLNINVGNKREYRVFMDSAYDSLISKMEIDEQELLSKCRKILFEYDFKSIQRMVLTNKLQNLMKNKRNRDFIIDYILFGDSPSGAMMKIDYIRYMIDKGTNDPLQKNAHFMIGRWYGATFDYLDELDLDGMLFSEINSEYYTNFKTQFPMADIYGDTGKADDIVSIDKIQSFLRNNLFWDTKNLLGVIPAYYKKNNWFYYEDIVFDEEGKLTVIAPVVDSIYSLVQLYGQDWNKVARYYNTLSVSKMPMGMMTDSLAKYLFEQSIIKNAERNRRIKDLKKKKF
tara:strand:- start:4805 stop:8017 length:3213 start_codon:yes stop_codon:yes gene_type:complete